MARPASIDGEEEGSKAAERLQSDAKSRQEDKVLGQDLHRNSVRRHCGRCWYRRKQGCRWGRMGPEQRFEANLPLEAVRTYGMYPKMLLLQSLK